LVYLVQQRGERVSRNDRSFAARKDSGEEVRERRRSKAPAAFAMHRRWRPIRVNQEREAVTLRNALNIKRDFGMGNSTWTGHRASSSNSILPPANIRSRVMDHRLCMPDAARSSAASAGRCTTRVFLMRCMSTSALRAKRNRRSVFFSRRAAEAQSCHNRQSLYVACEMIRTSDLIAVMPRDVCQRQA
jgi:hypothetical protein